MTRKELPADGDEREIFLRSLRYFSDTCEPQRLHPDCPFATDTAEPGVRACLDECLDLTAEYGIPERVDSIHFLEPGIAVEVGPTRGRQEASKRAKPFDARELFLIESELEVGPRWSISSLLIAIVHELGVPPADSSRSLEDREAHVDKLLTELGKRGVDADGALRHGLAGPLASSIAMRLVVPLIFSASPEIEPPEDFLTEEVPPVLDSWAELLLPDGATLTNLGDDPPSADRVFSEFVPSVLRERRTIAAWVATADLERIVRWEPPDAYAFRLLRSGDHEPDEVHVWLVDRFTRTYESEWSQSSLILEHQYNKGTQIPPCHTEEMRSRRVDKARLHEAIADKVAKDDAERSRADLTSHRYVDIAADMLRDGRRAAAAAIFEGQRRVSPTDATAHNNHGFCLLPDSPAAALSALEEAASLGLETWVVNVANRMLALHLVGRNSSALELAERFWPERPEAPEWAYLWDFATDLSDDPQLLEGADAVAYVARLACHIAQGADDAVCRVWDVRLADVTTT